MALKLKPRIAAQAKERQKLSKGRGKKGRKSFSTLTIGKMIPKMFPQGGDRKSEDKKSRYDKSTLKDFGISRNQSSTWQKITSIPKIA